jgi:hypothetical protein
MNERMRPAVGCSGRFLGCGGRESGPGSNFKWYRTVEAQRAASSSLIGVPSGRFHSCRIRAVAWSWWSYGAGRDFGQ